MAPFFKVYCVECMATNGDGMTAGAIDHGISGGGHEKRWKLSLKELSLHLSWGYTGDPAWKDD